MIIIIQQVFTVFQENQFNLQNLLVDLFLNNAISGRLYLLCCRILDPVEEMRLMQVLEGFLQLMVFNLLIPKQVD